MAETNIEVGWIENPVSKNKVAPFTLASQVIDKDGVSVADAMTPHANDIVGNRLYEVYNGLCNTIIANGFTNVLPASKQWVTIGTTNKKPIRNINFIVSDGGDGKYVGLGFLDIDGSIQVFNATSGAITSLYFSVSYPY